MQGHTAPFAELTGTAVGMIVGHAVKEIVKGQVINLLGWNRFSRFTGYLIGLTAGIVAFAISNLIASTLINGLGLDVGSWLVNIFVGTPLETLSYPIMQVLFDLAKEGLDALT